LGAQHAWEVASYRHDVEGVEQVHGDEAARQPPLDNGPVEPLRSEQLQAGGEVLVTRDVGRVLFVLERMGAER
jgi:hypothetical protein